MQAYIFTVLILITSLFSSNWSAITAPNSNLTTTGNQYIERAFTTTEGLPANGVNRVIQSLDGYIWAATYNGLIRYNGHEFFIYNTSNITGLESNRFVHLSQDQNGNIWGGLEMNQYVQISDTASVADTLEHEHLSTSDHITNVSITPNGERWIGTSNGLFIFDDENYQYQQHLPSDGVHNIVHHENESYIIFRRSVYRYNPQSQEFTPLLSIDEQGIIESEEFTIREFAGQHTRVADLLINDDGFFLLVNSAIIELTPEDYRIHVTAEELEQNLLLNLQQLKGDYLVTGTHGIYRMSFQEGEFANPEQIFKYHTNNIISDHEGTYWASTNSRGLRQFISTPAYLGDRYSFLDEITVTALLQDGNGTKWFGSNCNGLFRLDNDDITHFDTDNGLINTCIWSLLEDSGNNLWAGSWGGGLFFKPHESDRFELFEVDGSQSVNAILSLFQDSQDRIWIGTFFNGLYRLDDMSRDAVHIANSDGSRMSAIRQIYEDSRGKIWVATDRGIGYLEENHIVKPDSLKLLRTRNFRSITETDDGTLWFGSYGGGIIVKLNDGQIKTITSENGLLDETNSQMVFDHRRHLWLGGNLGVFSISSSQIESFLSGNSTELRISRYGIGEGLNVQETTGGFSPSSMIDENGILHIPTVLGLAVIQTDHVSVNTIPPKIVLESVTVDGQPYNPATMQSIPHNKQRIVFNTALLSFKNPEYNRFRYRLTGFDKEWRQGNAGQTIEYTQLSPGEYQLIVQGANNDGFWSDELHLATFTVTPPFWSTLPFYLISALMLILIGVTIFQYQVKSFKQRQEQLESKVRERTETLQNINQELSKNIEEKNRLHSILAHDLRNPFSSIIGYMQLLKEDFDESDHHKEKEIIDALLSAAKNTYNLLENLLQWSSAGRGLMPALSEFEINNVVSEAILMVKIQAEYKNIEIRFESEVDEITISADKNMILAVVRNIISNAVKFSDENSEIVIKLNSGPESVIISVEDEGIGMKPEEIDTLFVQEANQQKRGTKGERGLGLGLVICREFIDLHNGELHVESEHGNGSTFYIILPLHEHAHASAS
jgi:signal transduction histidine kinase/ligand-binding sensor domain-containing protein